MTQRRAFLGGEGDAWWARNRNVVDYGSKDPVIAAIGDLPAPASILEIGCAAGGRLEALRKLTGARCAGADPSKKAIAEGKARYGELNIKVGTANQLPFAGLWDVVIFGFCLYLLDREDLFMAVAEADRLLTDGGHLVVYDFCPADSCTRPYAHHPGMMSFKMDYSRLFTANPAYTESHRVNAGHGTAAIVLHKDIAAGWPTE